MIKQQLEVGVSALGLTLSEKQLAQLQTYVELLMRWNKVYNITAIRDVKQILPLHLFDSLAVTPFLQGSRCLDVGSGGGLPGIPLAIMCPEQAFVLLDTVGKKTRFMQQAVIQIALPHVSIVQSRVESWSPETAFDAIISRAFASLHDFVALSARHLKPDGRLYAMKGRYPAEELTQLPAGFQVIAEHKLEVPQLDAERFLIEITRENNHE